MPLHLCETCQQKAETEPFCNLCEAQLDVFMAEVFRSINFNQEGARINTDAIFGDAHAPVLDASHVVNHLQYAQARLGHRCPVEIAVDLGPPAVVTGVIYGTHRVTLLCRTLPEAT